MKRLISFILALVISLFCGMQIYAYDLEAEAARKPQCKHELFYTTLSS